MAAEQRNYQNYTYTDDNGVTWTKRGETDAIRNAVDGNAAAASHPTWNDTPRMKARRIIYQDPTTFRTKVVLFYTAAAFAAVALGDTLNFHVEGNAATVAYNAVKKMGEKQPSRAATRQLADHA